MSIMKNPNKEFFKKEKESFEKLTKQQDKIDFIAKKMGLM